jgi:hypothetical protein
MQPLLRFFHRAKNPDLDPRIVVEHLEHPREAELNRPARNQRRPDRRGDLPIHSLLRQRKDFLESHIDSLDSGQVRQPILQRPGVLQPLDFLDHCIEVRPIEDPEQAGGVEVAFVTNLEGHGRSLGRHAPAQASSSSRRRKQDASAAAVTPAAGRHRYEKMSRFGRAFRVTHP